MNCRSAPWARAFTSTAPARSTFQASACRQLPSPKLTKKMLLYIMSDYCEILRVIRHNRYLHLGNGLNKFGNHCFKSIRLFLVRTATSWYFWWGGQNDCILLYLINKHALKISGAIARLSPWVAGLVPGTLLIVDLWYSFSEYYRSGIQVKLLEQKQSLHFSLSYTVSFTVKLLVPKFHNQKLYGFVHTFLDVGQHYEWKV